MRKALRIARREYAAQVRTKGFFIGLALAPLLACGGMIAFLLLKDRVDLTDKRVAIVDRSGVLAEALLAQAERRNEQAVHDPETGEKVRPAFLFEIVAPDPDDPPAQRLALSDRVRARQLFAYVEIGRDVVHPTRGEDSRITYHSSNPLSEGVRGWLSSPVNERLRELRAREAAVDQELVEQVTRWAPIEGHGLVSVDRGTGEVRDSRRTNEMEAVFVPMGCMMLLFMMMMIGTMPLIGAVQEEKNQRIAEVLVGSIRPFGLMMGKLLGGVAVSLTSLSVYLVIGYAVIQYMEAADFVPFHVLPWLLLYMVASVFMFGAILSAVGAACSQQSEVQSLMPFAMLPMIFPMFIWFAVVREPLGAFATSLSFVPPFTPTLMMLRQATPASIPAWQPWVAVVGMLAFTVFSVWAGGRIFRVGILLQGQPPKIGTLLRWVVRG